IDLLVGFVEVAAVRGDAKRFEEIRGDDANHYLFGIVAGEIGRAWIVAEGDEAVERLVGRAIVDEIGWRNVGKIAEREFAIEPDEAIGVCERERAEDDGVDDAEDGGVGADAESERENGDEREAWIFAQSAECV